MKSRVKKEPAGQTRLILSERLRQYAAMGVLPMHMPGHKRNAAAYPWLDNLGCSMDITEIAGFDNLNDPQTFFRDLECRAARLWGAKESVCLVNGSTGGVLAAVRAVLERGGGMLMGRGSHRAVYHAAELMHIDPLYLSAPIDAETGIAGTAETEETESILAAHPEIRLVCVTSPTYEGMIADVAALAAVCHRHGAALLVDEAHGAHLGFGGFPQNAIRCGADLAVQSLHKTLPSLTQTAILHIGGDRIDPADVRRNVAMLQTSSPSYLLAASIDGCIDYLEREGEEAANRWLAWLNLFDWEMRGLRSLEILGPERRFAGNFAYARDPSKVLIATGRAGRTGPELMDALRERYRIELEMAAPDYALAMTGMGDTRETLSRLAQALRALDAACPGPQDAPPPCRPVRLTIPQKRMPPYAAMTAPKVLLPAKEALGRVSGEYVWAYPPGIPLLAPGEIIDAPTLAALQSAPSLHSTQGAAPECIACLSAE